MTAGSAGKKDDSASSCRLVAMNTPAPIGIAGVSPDRIGRLVIGCCRARWWLLLACSVQGARHESRSLKYGRRGCPVVLHGHPRCRPVRRVLIVCFFARRPHVRIGRTGVRVPIEMDDSFVARWMQRSVIVFQAGILLNGEGANV
jgi:hypothetical protein